MLPIDPSQDPFFLREANVSAVSCLGTAPSATETPRIQAVKTYPNQLRHPVEPRIHEGTASRAEVVLFRQAGTRVREAQLPRPKGKSRTDEFAPS